MGEASAQHRRWYYELVVDHVDPFLTSEPTHLRVGWACTKGYLPRPTGGEGWGGNGLGDDLCSYGFDGLHLWSGEDDSICLCIAYVRYKISYLSDMVMQSVLLKLI